MIDEELIQKLFTIHCEMKNAVQKKIVGKKGGPFEFNLRTLLQLKETIEKDTTMEQKPWPAMRRDVTTFIRRCDTCIKLSEKKLKHMTSKYVTSTYGVFENIAIDALSLQETKSGNKHLLTIIDTTTRYTVLKPLRDLTAKAAAQALIEYMCVYGIPQKIQSDNGTQFMKEFQEHFNK
jgi:hypothetical protein